MQPQMQIFRGLGGGVMNVYKMCCPLVSKYFIELK